MRKHLNNSPLLLDWPQISLYLYEQGNSVIWKCTFVLDIEAYGGVEVHIQTAINLALDLTAASAALPGHFIPSEMARKTH
jgi:hypothetical protein